MSRPPDGIKGHTTCVKTGCGKLYVTDNTDGEYKEIFLQLGKTGGCAAALMQALAITASLALRAGVPKEKLIKNWKGISCPSPYIDTLSCVDGIAKALENDK